MRSYSLFTIDNILQVLSLAIMSFEQIFSRDSQRGFTRSWRKVKSYTNRCKTLDRKGALGFRVTLSEFEATMLTFLPTQLQGFLQKDCAEQARVHLRGGRRLRDHQGSEKQVPVLPFQKVHRPGHGTPSSQGRSHARWQEFRSGVQPLQSEYELQVYNT